MQVVLLALSCVVRILDLQRIVVLGGRDADVVALAGYIATPLIVVLLFALARRSDLLKRSDPYYDGARGTAMLRLSGGLTAVSFGLGIWHVLDFASRWALQ